jgi:hypothetical protein
VSQYDPNFPSHGEMRVKFSKSEAALLKDIEIVAIKEISAKEMARLG